MKQFLKQFSPYWLFSLILIINACSCNKKTAEKTQTSSVPFLTVPSLATVTTSSITDTSAVSGGTISSSGGASILAYGVCWSTSENPTTANNKTIDGNGIGCFSSSLSGLIGNTIYHLRAYATNATGTGYGNDISFTSKSSIKIPVLTTAIATSVTQTTAMSGGNISSDGGSIITARGVCWSQFIIPTTDNPKTMDGAGQGTFSSNITGLLPNTAYYIRAYATNRWGTAYGDYITINTLTLPGYPSINTLPAFYLPGFTLIRCGGKITSDGGYPIAARGICWSETSTLPTLSSFYRTSTEVSDSFHVTIGIPLHTTFYIRAFATNSIGTSYGRVVIFSRQ